jgi:hypothetical protein
VNNNGRAAKVVVADRGVGRGSGTSSSKREATESRASGVQQEATTSTVMAAAETAETAAMRGSDGGDETADLQRFGLWSWIWEASWSWARDGGEREVLN